MVDSDARLRQLLTSEERQHLREMIYTNIGLSSPVSSSFFKSCCGLPTMGAAIYSHLWIGIVNYILQKQGLDPATVSIEELRGAVRLVTYYRSPILVEEMNRLGYSRTETLEATAKAFFLQYWSGNHFNDPLIFNPMTRGFYPTDKHIIMGAADLGREQEFQGARLWALGYEKMPVPLTIMNAGDTLSFTDGAMSMLQHMIEASERGIKMPIIFMINSNNSSISSRLSNGTGDALRDSEEGVRRIEERIAHWGKAVGPGFRTSATDVAGGVQAMRDAVDQVLETGKPTYVISAFPFRPLGHASDASPAEDELLKGQFDSFREALVRQISAATEPGMTGTELALELEGIRHDIDEQVGHALVGNKLLNRAETEELSVPGITAIKQDPGYIIDVPSGYLLGKGVKSFAGMGSDIYGEAIDKLFTELEQAGRLARYIHQENHKPNTTDTRGGVYGELSRVGDHHLYNKFVNLLPNEAQIAQLGGGFRAALPGDSVVIVKGPHTLFNEHAKSFLKYAAYRHCDTRDNAGFVYLMDGYNIAAREREVITTSDGEKMERDFIMARVGEHHNSPYYSGYMADPNTTCAVPLDMNLFKNMLPEMVRLQDLGRVVLGFLPTYMFGILHPAFSKGDIPLSRGITQNDILKVSFLGRTPSNGKHLVVITYGPDSKWIAQTLTAQGVQATLIILSYLKAPNSLIAYLDDQARAGIPTEVLSVDPNPESAVMAPIMSVVKNSLGYPEALHFSDCSAEPMFVPWGYGGSLLNSADLLRVLSMRGIIERHVSDVRPSVVRAASSGVAKQAATESAPAGIHIEGMEEILNAPMDGENVMVSFRKQVGDQVNVDDVVAEIESDKATVEVISSTAGKLTKFFVKEHTEMNVTMDTQICSIAVGGLDAGAAPPLEMSLEESNYVRFEKVSTQANKLSAEDVKPLSRLHLAMVDNMTVKVGDTRTYTVGESVDFSSVQALSKHHGVSPTTALVKILADSAQSLSLNKKLSSDKQSMRVFTKSADIGMAVEVAGQLRVAVVHDASSKSLADIAADIENFKAKGSKLSPEEQDLDSVCFVLTSLGKNAPEQAYATLPRGVTGILAVGRMEEGRSNFIFTLCHATLNGSEGARLLAEVVGRAESR